MDTSFRLVTCASTLALLAASQSAHADATTAQQNGTPPSDVAAGVTQQKDSGAVPAIKKPSDDITAAAVNAGAQFATGNSRLVAVTAGGKLDMRRGNNAFGAALTANYAEAYTAPVAPATNGTWANTTENVQGKLRYDRFFTERFAGFLQLTGTHDAFQATAFRLNVDPGVKYIFVDRDTTKLWGEIGYDFEFDDNYTDSQGFEQAGAGGKVLDATTSLPVVIVQTNTMHSARVYAGFRHAFSKDVTLGAGLEFLQGFGGSGDGFPDIPAGFSDATISRQKLNLVRSRLNFDALFAARISGGLSVGIGFTLKYNSDPLPGKETVDTTTTLSLIYAFTSPNKDKDKPPPPPPCEPCTTAPIVVTPPPPPPPDAASNVAIEGVTFTPAGDVDAQASKDALKSVVDMLKTYPNVAIVVSGAKAQADALRAALVAAGADGARITSEAREGTLSVRVTAK
jgi:putative salt-induced outer membrane protein YdiY